MRYRLLPYLYTAFWQAAQTGLPMMRPLFLAYQDEPHARSLEDEFLFGDAILVAPITTAGQTSRQAYLPPGRWYDFWDDTPTGGPQISRLDAPLHRLPLLVRAGSIVPAWPLMQHTGEQPVETLILHLYPGTGDSVLYEDDGHTQSFRHGHYRLTRFQMQTEWALEPARPAQIHLRLAREGQYQPEYKQTRVVLHGLATPPQEITVDGQVVAATTAKPGTNPCLDFGAPSCPSIVLEKDTVQAITIRTASGA
jgi:alpha-glucosidase